MDQQALDAAVKIHSILFSPANEVVGKNGKKTKIKQWTGFRSVDLAGYRFITQNPNKDSKHGRLAQAGVQITWVIRLKGNEWIGKVMDGVLTPMQTLEIRYANGVKDG